MKHNDTNTFLVSTIVRGALPWEASAYFYRVTLDGDVVRFALPEARLRHKDPNPRGGMRGARGIAVCDEDIFIANFDTVFRFDRDLRLVDSMSSAYCADIHDLCVHDGRLWAASTRNDTLIAFDRRGKVDEIINLRARLDMFELVGELPSAVDYRDPETHEQPSTDRLHVNSFAFDLDGGVLVSVGQFRCNAHAESAVVQIDRRGMTRTLHRSRSAAVPAHNIVLRADGSMLRADTENGVVVALYPDRPDDVTAIIEVESGYVRGLCLIDDVRFVLGVQNEIWICDGARGAVLRKIWISADARESVHSIVAYACL